MNPRPHTVMSHDSRPMLGEHAVSRHMIQVIVGVDHELDRKMREAVDLAKQCLRCGFIFKRIDHGHAVVADHKSSVGPSIAFCVVNRRPDVRADKFQLKGKRRIRRLAQENRGGKTEKKRQSEEKSHYSYRTASGMVRIVPRLFATISARDFCTTPFRQLRPCLVFPAHEFPAATKFPRPQQSEASSRREIRALEKL